MLKNVEELRLRLIRSLVVIFVVFLGSLYFASDIINFLKVPLFMAMENRKTVNLYFTGPLEVFMAGLKVSFLMALVVSAPYFLYQVWAYLKTTLDSTRVSHKVIAPCLVGSVILFFVGVVFCFYVILPLGLRVLLLDAMQIGSPVLTVSEYLSLVFAMLFGFGLVFETPLVLILLSVLGFVKSEQLTSQRKLVVVLSLLFGAVLTTPDPVTQIAMAVPLYIMYEIAILVIKILERRRLV